MPDTVAAKIGKDDRGKSTFLTNAGYYHDEWRRTAAGWRIRERGVAR